MITVWLAVSDSETEERVREYLRSDWEVFSSPTELGERRAQPIPDPPEERDLLIADGSVLREIGSSGIGSYKSPGTGSESPILAIVTPAELAELDPEILEQVDDVLRTPIVQAELDYRIRALLPLSEPAAFGEDVQTGTPLKYKELFDGSAHGILLLSGEDIVEANRRAGELFGKAPEGLVGCSLSDFLASAGRSKRGRTGSDNGRVDQLLECNGEAAEWRFDPPGANPFWAEVTCSSVCYGGEECVQAVVSDVTLRRRRKRWYLLEETQRVAGVGGWSYDRETGRAHGTNELARLLKRPDVTDVGLKEALSDQPQEVRTQLLRAATRCAETGEPFDLEVLFVTNEGERRWARVCGEARREGDSVVELVGTLQDITERKETELQLRRSRDRLATAEHASGLGSWEIDLETGRAYWSEETYRIFGWDRDEEITFEKFIEAVHPDDRENVRRERAGALHDGEPMDVTFRISRPDGEERILVSRGERTVDDEGAPVRLSGAVYDVTDQKETERRLRRSREQLRTAQRIANLGSWERDLEEDELYWSAETRRIFGWLPDEAVSYAMFMDAVHPDDRDELRRQQELCRKDGTPIDVEYRIRCRNGESRVVRERGEADIDEDGSVVCLTGAVLDITERRRRERELERLRKKYEGLLRGAPDALFVAQKETGEIVEANRAAASLLDAPVEEIVGRNQYELHPSGEEERYRRLFESHQQSAENESVTRSRFEDGSPVYVATDSGESIPVEINATLVDLGEEEYFLGSFRDITKRRQAERRRRLFEEAVAQSGDMIFITDPDGVIEYANPATEEITGYEREELVGRTPSLLQSEDTFEQTYEDLWETIKGGEVYRNTFVDRRKDGSLIHIDQTITPLEDESGEIACFVSTGRDVTARRERERTLRERERALRRHRNLLAQTQRLAGGWEVDVETGEMTWSEEVYRIHELSPDEQVDLERALSFYAPEDRARIRKAYLGSLRGNDEFDLELALTTANGNRRWVRMVGAPTDTDEEDGGKVAGAFQDLTQRKEAERAVRRREARLRGLTNSVPGIVFQLAARTGRGYGIRFVSDRASDILGLEATVDGFFERLVERIPRSHAENFRSTLDEAVQTESGWRFEMPFEKPSGERIWLLATATPDNRNGELLFNGVLLDISQRKETEVALEDERDRFATLYHNLPTPVIHGEIRDGADCLVAISDVNAAFERVFGFDADEVRGSPLDEVIVPDDGYQQHRQITLTGLENGEVNEEVERLTTEGPRRFMLQAAVRESEEGPIEVYGIYSDITEEYRRRERRRRQRNAVVELTTDEAVASGEFDTAVRRITETATEVLDVARVNVWLLDSDAGLLRCTDHYERSAERHSSGMELDMDEYPRYFEALSTHRIIDAVDAGMDHRTSELADDYLEPHGVGSLLDATLRSEGDVIGVVCHEHVGGPRDWARDEIQFAEQVADIVHRALRNREEAERRRQIEFQQSLLQAQQRAVLDGILATDRTGEIVLHNEQLQEIWGVPEQLLEEGRREDVFDWMADELAAPGDLREQVRYFSDRPSESSRGKVELENGRVFDQYSAPLRGPSGTHYGRIWTFRDITEQRQRVEQLRRRRERIEALYSATGELFKAERPLDVAVQIEEVISETFGYPFTSVRFVKDGELVPMCMSPETSTQLPERGARPIDGDSLGARVYRSEESIDVDDLALLDNEIDYGDLRAGACVPMGDHGVIDLGSTQLGQIDRFDLRLVEILAAHATLVLNSLEHLDAVRSSEQRFRGVFENAAVGIVLLNEDEEIVDTNPILRELTGYVVDELEGRRLSEITHHEFVYEGQKRFRELAGGARDHYQMETKFVRKDGGVFWGRVTVSRHAGGEEAEVIGMIEDIDEQKRYERELLVAKEEAEEASRLKSALLANMSHEVRTPLTGIIGFSEVLKKNLDGELSVFAEKTYASSQRLLQTLNSVLQLSRLEARAPELRRESMELGRVVRKTVDLLRREAEKKEISLRSIVPDEPIEGYWNRDALNRILENLVENAIKFTPEGGEVRVSAEGRSDEGVLSVSDNGIGIDEDALPDIFRAFKQESEGLGREYEGSGLGLSIVSELTDALDGEIEVQTEKGEGTTFTVRIPRNLESGSP